MSISKGNILVVAIIVISIIIVVVTVLVKTKRSSTDVECSDTSLDLLPSLLADGVECSIQGVNSGLWYLPSTGYTLSSNQTSIVSICSDDSVCEGEVISNDCSGVVPMARIGTVRYYPFMKGCSICDQCQTTVIS